MITSLYADEIQVARFVLFHSKSLLTEDTEITVGKTILEAAAANLLDSFHFHFTAQTFMELVQ